MRLCGHPGGSCRCPRTVRMLHVKSVKTPAGAVVGWRCQDCQHVMDNPWGHECEASA